MADEQDEKNQTALHLAAGDGHDKVVQQLLEKGVKIDVEDGEGRTALHLAAGDAHDKVVQRLLEVGARTDARDRRGRTAFHMAAEYGHEGVIQQLLKYAVETDAEDGEGRTALYSAAELGRDGIIPQLLENGVQPSDRAGEKVLELVRKKVKPKGRSSTLQEIGDGERILRLMFEKDTKRHVDVNTEEGLRILRWTAERHYEKTRWEIAEQVAKLLVGHGAKANSLVPSQRSGEQTTILQFAASSARTSVMRVLLGADDVVSGGETVLAPLIKEHEEEDGRPEMLRLLRQSLDSRRHGP